MTILSETKFNAIVKRTRGLFKSSTAQVYITESKTNWYVTILLSGYELPTIQNWKVSKKEASTKGEAFRLVEAEAIEKKYI